MQNYILKRLLLMIPTILGILLVNFLIVQAAPGGPVEQLIFKLTHPGLASSASGHTGGGLSDAGAGGQAGAFNQSTDVSRGSRGLDPEMIEQIKKLYGFDKPAHERFTLMLKNYLQFDFGESFYRNDRVIDIIVSKLPVSISLGLWTTLLVYLISIPLGIRKAIKDGSPFDVWSSWVIVIGYAIPSFLFAILLIILFAGGSYFDWFPMRGLFSENFDNLSWYEKVGDYFWHLCLPVTAMVLSGFASLTMLTKNSFLDEIKKQYVFTARSKGLTERQVLYNHVFRNAMLIVIAGLPHALLKVFFTSALLIEVIFSLDGLGLLGFEAALTRDYPVMFATLYIYTLMGLILSLIGDITYTLVDPRIDFERRIG